MQGPSLNWSRNESISHGSKTDPSLLKSMSLQVADTGTHGPSPYTERNASISTGSNTLVSLLKSMESHVGPQVAVMFAALLVLLPQVFVTTHSYTPSVVGDIDVIASVAVMAEGFEEDGIGSPSLSH